MAAVASDGDGIARAAGQPQEKVAVVTGGSRGIGKDICLVLAEQGYAGIAINFRSDASRAKAEAVAAQIEASGSKAKTLLVQADVSVEDDVKRLFAEVDAKLGKVTALVNNAAILGSKEADVEKLGLDDLTRVLKVNVHGEECEEGAVCFVLPSALDSLSPCPGPFLCTREASKRMSVRNGGKGGCVVNVSSGSALIGSPFCYAISKGALNSMQAGLVKDLAAKGIRINTV